MACSSSKRNSASARASSVLPTPVGPRKRNEPIGRLGSERPERERRMALDDRGDRFVLADDAACAAAPPCAPTCRPRPPCSFETGCRSSGSRRRRCPRRRPLPSGTRRSPGARRVRASPGRWCARARAASRSAARPRPARSPCRSSRSASARRSSYSCLATWIFVMACFSACQRAASSSDSSFKSRVLLFEGGRAVPWTRRRSRSRGPCVRCRAGAVGG